MRLCPRVRVLDNTSVMINFRGKFMVGFALGFRVQACVIAVKAQNLSMVKVTARAKVTVKVTVTVRVKVRVSASYNADERAIPNLPYPEL